MNTPADFVELTAKVTCLAPRAPAAAALEFLTESTVPLLHEPFAPERLAALAALSKALLKDPTLRLDPSTVALAYWLRPANLETLRQEALRTEPARTVRTPAGVVFHIAPANVDTLFVYSWALSFLCGNLNVVRLSTSTSWVVEAILQVLAGLAEAEPAPWRGNVFVTYPHDDAVTGWFSQRCDQRIVWGGDETIARIRSVALKPHAAERAFASKFSASVLDAVTLHAASAEELRRIASLLARDIGPFGQKACSSPHVLYWIGGDVAANRGLAARFSDAVAADLRGGKASDVGDAVWRIEQGFLLAADGIARDLKCAAGLAVAEIDAALPPVERMEIGAGFLSHRFVPSVEAVAQEATTRHQTLTYYGLDDAACARLAREAGKRGVDRIVPVGSALEFDAVWDGFALLNDFTRQVAVR